MVTVAATDGSTPREAGARMVVLPDGGFHGTIGGGTMEWRALAEAQRALQSGGARARWIRQSLGPELGQCCGGRVTLLVEVIDGQSLVQVRDFAALEAAAASPAAPSMSMAGSTGSGWNPMARRRSRPISPPTASSSSILARPAGRSLLFGAGHVGRALVLALAPLPLRSPGSMSRPEAFPARLPANAYSVVSASPVGDVAVAPAGSFVLIMSHSHALDLDITDAALADGRFPYVGLIGSGTKRARFVKRLREAGLPEDRIASLVCPIGIAGIGGKAPAVIAAATAAELLHARRIVACGVAPAGILGQTA